MRPFFEGKIPHVEGSLNTRRGSDYVCAVCYNIIATFEHVKPEEFAEAAKAIDPLLQDALKSSVHFRADFEPIAREVLVVTAPGPAKADPTQFAWSRLRPGLRLKPLGPPFAPAGGGPSS